MRGALTVSGWTFLSAIVAVYIYVIAGVARGGIAAFHKRLALAATAALWMVTGLVLLVRFGWGLGAVTAMNDRVPWGVWIGLLQSGVALAAGGYVIAATVHVFHLKRFHDILRPMVLTAFLGYLFVALTLFIEVGRPQALWHPLVMWQHNSIMFEVAWCVTLYMTVLLVEFSSVVFERIGWQRAVKVLHAVAIPLVIAGVILSTLHQSSMGSMFLIVPEKIHPLWQSPLLPVFFLVSSVAVGLSVTLLESFFSHRVFGRSLNLSMLEPLATASAAIFAIYGAMKLVDVLARETWRPALDHPGLAAAFIVELLLSSVIPAILLYRPSAERKARWMAAGAGLGALGIIFNRINVSWISMIPYAGADYFPTWMELAISLFLLTVSVTLFGLAVKFLPAFPASIRPKTV